MSLQHSKEEGEISDEEDGRHHSRLFPTPYSGGRQDHPHVLHTFRPKYNSDFHPPDFRNEIFQWHTQKPRFGSLPSPRTLFPFHRPPIRMPAAKQREDRACIIIKNNGKYEGNAFGRKLESPVTKFPTKSPASKIWENRKLRNSKDKTPAKQKSSETDSYSALLQQYKDVQGRLALLRNEDAKLNGASETLSESVEQNSESFKDDLDMGTSENYSADIQASSPVVISESPASPDPVDTSIAMSTDNDGEYTATDSGHDLDTDQTETEEQMYGSSNLEVPDEQNDLVVVDEAECDNTAAAAGDNDDEDLGELELRRNALASMLAEAKEETDDLTEAPVTAPMGSDQIVSKPARRVAEGVSRQDRHSASQSLLRAQESSPRHNTDGRVSRHPRLLRGSTPALRPRKAGYRVQHPSLYKSEDRVNRRTIPAARRRQIIASASRSRSRPVVERSRSSGIQSVDERSVMGRGDASDKSRDAAEKTREIQRILTLDDPKEQVARFLSLLQTDMSHDFMKSEDGRGQSRSKKLSSPVPPSSDNYEEVEMDIDSDADSPGAVNPMDELQFEPDFYNAMQPMQYNGLQQMMDPYDPSQTWPGLQQNYQDSILQTQYMSAPMMSYPDSGLPVMPYSSVVYHEQTGQYVHSDQMIPGSLPELSGLADVPPPPPPPPLPHEPPPQPPLPPSDTPPLPSTPPALPPLPPGSESESFSDFYASSRSDYLPFEQNTVFASSQQKAEDPDSQKYSFYQTSQQNSEYHDSWQNMTYHRSQHNAENYDNQHETQYLNSAKNSALKNTSLEYASSKSANLDQSGNIDHSLVIVSQKRGSDRVQAVSKSNVTERPQSPEDSVDRRSGEEEEAMLRAQLLRSMANRLKERQKQLEEAKRSESPSSVSRSQSPMSVTSVRSTRPTIQKHSYSRIHRGDLPIHKPVIIKLGEDSSDEEEPSDISKHASVMTGPSYDSAGPTGVQKLLGGLDVFLKEARRSAETSQNEPIAQKEGDLEKILEQKRRKALMSRLQQDEVNLRKQSEMITKDQMLLKTLVTQASKYLQNVKVSEAKVKQLTEQLTAAETVATANREALEKAKKQARLIKDRLLKKKMEYEELEKGLLDAGRELYGASYKIGVQPAVLPVSSAASPVSMKRIVQSTNALLVIPQVQSKQAHTAGKLKIKENMLITVNRRVISHHKVSQSGNNSSVSPPKMLTSDISMKNMSNSIAAVQSAKVDGEASPGKPGPAVRKVCNKGNVSVQVLESKPGTEQQRLVREKLAREKEKKRLKVLALQYEIKIREMKLKQSGERRSFGNKVSVAAEKKNISPASLKKEPEMSKSVLTLEKIELGSDPIDLTNEQEHVTKHRKTLMELNPSCKPDLKPKSDLLRSTSTEQVENKFEISLPEGKDLQRILKLQRTRVEDDLRMFSSHPCVSQTTQMYPALVNRQQQLSSLPAYRNPASSVSSSGSGSSDFVYRSPLLHFRSYRFNPYFRTKSCKMLTSCSVGHKLLPKVVLCRYEIQGSCNDDKCKAQHVRQYQLSEREILQDILAYCPTLAGIQKDTLPKRVTKLMGDYVDKFMALNHGKLSLDEMCLLLVSKINEHFKHVPPHTMLYTPRLFRPKQDEKLYLKSDGRSFKHTKEETEFQLHAAPELKAEDSIINSEDRRYFFTDTGEVEVQDLESLVQASPHDIHLWLKLARRKYNCSTRISETSLEEALNVLARALEANKDSCDLWLEYLTLYAKHKDASDLTDLCQMALQYAPSFDIWWKYLHSLASYTDRNEVCSEIVDYLCSIQTRDCPNPSISHHLLEVMLYKTNLSIMSGQPQYAKNILQGYFVKSETKASCQSYLTVEDCCILWLSYIHLMSWQHLPVTLLDDVVTGKITNKKDLVLPWEKSLTGDCTHSQQMALLQEAVNVCITKKTTGSGSEIKEGLILYKNMVQLLRCQNQLEEMLGVCRSTLEMDQSLEDIWLTVADLYAANGETDATIQVFNDAMEVNPTSAKVFMYAAYYGMSHNKDLAETCLECYPRGFFVEDSATVVSSTALYCLLLNQTLPVGCTPPSFKDDVSREVITDQLPYIWLNYCLLLEERTDYATCIEMYETALSSVSRAEDIGKIWSGFLRFQHRQLLSCPDSVAEQRRMNYLLHRCVLSMPVKVPVEHWGGELMLDYSPLNSVIDTYLKCLLPEQHREALERLVVQMPNNITLVLRLCWELLRQGDDGKALSLCYPLVYEGTPDLRIWKLATTLAIKQRSHSQVQRIFQKAVQTMPYNLSTWKDWLIYQMTQGDFGKDMIQAILKFCSLLGLNVEQLLVTLRS